MNTEASSCSTAFIDGGTSSASSKVQATVKSDLLGLLYA